MATVRTLVRTQAHHSDGPSGMAGTLNRTLKESVSDASFVTGVYGVLDPATGQVAYANCGHDPPLHVRPCGADVLSGRGPVLGVFEEAPFASDTCRLAPGDRLVLYTDGVVECTSASGEEFGLGRLQEVLVASMGLTPSAVVQEVLRATRDFSGQSPCRDDFTLVVLGRSVTG